VRVVVPGGWSVRRGHDLVEDVEAALRDALPYANVLSHLEPTDDPRSFADTTLAPENMPTDSSQAPG
jgi:divalent metal cation (Fe/Co/Zn/Cd) transporter